MGDVSVAGLLGPVAMTASAGLVHTFRGNLPHPGFVGGAAIELAATGTEAVAAFTLRGQGVDPPGRGRCRRWRWWRGALRPALAGRGRWARRPCPRRSEHRQPRRHPGAHRVHRGRHRAPSRCPRPSPTPSGAGGPGFPR
ncbi:MAG: hypothetical protein R3F43_25080 [bacterium]